MNLSFKNKTGVFIYMLLFVFSTIIFSPNTYAAQGVPTVLSYQGKLTDSGGNPLGGGGTNYNFKFSIWDNPTPGNGNKLWPSTSPSPVQLIVRQGTFSVDIGSDTYPDALNYDFNTNSKIYLQVEVSGDGMTYETLAPRSLISSSAFSQVANSVNGTADSSFGTTTPFVNTLISVLSTSVNKAVMTIKGAVGQVANLFNILDSNDNSLFTVTADGKVGVGTSTPEGKMVIVNDSTTKIPFIIKSINSQSVSSLVIQNGLGSAVFSVGPGGNASLGGALSLPNGSVSNPSVTFNSDSNTGIFTPSTASDILAFSTAGTERLRIDSVGNVGIGMTATKILSLKAQNTSDGLEVYSSTNAEAEAFLGLSTARVGMLALRNAGSTKINLNANAASTINTGYGLGIGTTTANAMLDVWGNLSVGTSSTPALFVNTATGNVGLGTNAPESLAAMHIIKAGAGAQTGLILQNTGAGVGDSIAIDFRPHSSAQTGGQVMARISAVRGGSGTPTDLVFSTGAYNAALTEIMRITSPVIGANNGPGGYVGIGSSTPYSKLTVAGSDNSSSNSVLNLTNNSNNSLFFVRNDGNVGLGTNAPTTKLVLSGSDNTFLTIDNTTSGNAGICLDGNGGQCSGLDYTQLTVDTSGNFTINNQKSTGVVKFNTNNTERLRIDSSGNVGIGTTTIPRKLTVDGSAHIFTSLSIGQGNTASNGVFDISYGGIQGMLLGGDLNVRGRTDATNKYFYAGSAAYLNSNNPSALFVAINTSSANTLNVGGGTGSMNALTQMDFYTASDVGVPVGTSRLTINNSGNVLVNTGSLGVGVTNPYDRLEVSSSTPGGLGGRLVISNRAARTDGNTAELGFKVNSNFAATYYSALISALQEPGATDNSSLAFYTYNSSAARGTEKMRITSGGNIGIGTTNPTSSFSRNIQVTGAGSAAMTLDNGSKKYSFGVTGTNSLGFYDETSSAYRLMVDSTGNIGIGTTTPSNALEVIGRGAFSNGIVLTGTPTSISDVNYIQTSNSASTVGFLAGSGVFSSASGPYFGARGNTYTAIGGQRGQMWLSAGAVSSPTGLEGTIQFLTSVDSGNGESSRMIINRSGNVGIATTNPLNKLDVNGSVALGIGTGAANGNVAIRPDSGSQFWWGAGALNGTTTTYLESAWVDSAGNPLYSRDLAITGKYGANVGNLTIKSDSSFFNGNISIGTTTSTAKVNILTTSAATKGLVLNAATSQSANLAEFNFDSTTYSQFNNRGGLYIRDEDVTAPYASAGRPLLTLDGPYGSTIMYGSNMEIGNINLLNSTTLYIGRGGGGLNVGAYNGPITSKFAVNGNAVIGTNYNLLTAPTNGLAVEGNVGIGTTTPTQKLSVIGNAQFTGVTSGTYAFDLNLTSDGTLTTSASDERLKTNIMLLSSTTTLDKLNKLKPSEFDWKENNSHDIGLIAQEVEQIFPELVFTNPTDGFKGVNYSRFITLIISSIQELSRKVDGMFDGTATVKVKELCIEDVCVTKNQLQQLLLQQNIQTTPTTYQEPSTTTENTSTDTNQNSSSTVQQDNTVQDNVQNDAPTETVLTPDTSYGITTE